MQIIRKAAGLGTTIVLSLALVVLLLVAFGAATQKFRIVPVLSGSMRPTMPEGSLAVVVPKALPDIEVGDAIVYEPPGQTSYILHRVVEVVKSGRQPVVRTKGDANDKADAWTAKLQGDVVWESSFAVPYAGYPVVWARQPVVRTAAITLAVVLLVGLGLVAIWRKPQGEPAPEPEPAVR